MAPPYAITEQPSLLAWKPRLERDADHIINDTQGHLPAYDKTIVDRLATYVPGYHDPVHKDRVQASPHFPPTSFSWIPNVDQLGQDPIRHRILQNWHMARSQVHVPGPSISRDVDFTMSYCSSSPLQ